MAKKWERKHIVLEVWGRTNKEMKALEEWLEDELSLLIQEDYTKETQERVEISKEKAQKQLERGRS